MKKIFSALIVLMIGTSIHAQTGVKDFSDLMVAKKATPVEYKNLILIYGWVLQAEGYDPEIQSNYIKLSHGLNETMEMRYSKDMKYLNYANRYNTIFQQSAMDYLNAHGYKNDGTKQSNETNQRWTLYEHMDANFNDLTYVKIIETFNSSNEPTKYEYEIIW